MTPADFRQFAELVADVLTQRGLVSAAVGAQPLCPGVLTVAEFAVAINRCRTVVCRRIASRYIDRAHVWGPPYTINRDALAKFKVSFELAAERLAARVAQAPAATPQRPAMRSAA